MAADIEALAESRSLVAYDLRGRGRSSAVEDPSRLGLERDLADLEALRDALSVETMSILGWSYHAGLAARYALEHPDRVDRLVLVGPSAPKASPYFEEFLNRFAGRVDGERLARLERWRREGVKERNPLAWCRAVHDLFFRAWVADPGCLERMRSSPCVEPNLDADRVNDQGRRVIEMQGNFDWTGDFGELAVPTLGIHGAEDPVPLEGSEEWIRCLPDARLMVFEEAGHMPWIERPERFFPAVERFLGGEWPV